MKIVWFKRWGAPEDIDIDRRYGSVKPKGEIPDDRIANEMFVLQKPSRRNSWYGIPGYAAAIGWISLALAARDDNLLFFLNRREPRWAIIMSNLEDNGNLDEDLRNIFAIDLKSPHRNIFIPISGNGKIEFKQLTNDKIDGTFDKLGDRANAEVLVAHRVPPERLGLIKVGNLGGNAALDSSRVYKEAVIQPDQIRLSQRLNRFISREYSPKRSLIGKDTTLGWRWYPVEMDLAEEEEDLRNAVIGFKAGIYTMNEARIKSHMPRLDPAMFPTADGSADGTRGIGDMFVFELFLLGGSWDTGDPGAEEEQPGDKLGGPQSTMTPDASIDPNTKPDTMKSRVDALTAAVQVLQAQSEDEPS